MKKSSCKTNDLFQFKEGPLSWHKWPKKEGRLEGDKAWEKAFDGTRPSLIVKDLEISPCETSKLVPHLPASNTRFPSYCCLSNLIFDSSGKRNQTNQNPAFAYKD